MNTNTWSESILHTREHTITALLATCRGYVQWYSSSSSLASTICRAERPPRENPYGIVCITTTKHYREQCDTLMFGSLIKALMGIGLFPLPANASEIFMSVSTMASKLSTIDGYALADRENERSSHENCKFGSALCHDVDRLLDTMPSALRNSHRKNFEEKSKK